MSDSSRFALWFVSNAPLPPGLLLVPSRWWLLRQSHAFRVISPSWINMTESLEGTWLRWTSDLIIKASEMGPQSKSINLFQGGYQIWELLMTISCCDKASGWPQNIIGVWREAEVGHNGGGCHIRNVLPVLLSLRSSPLGWPRICLSCISQSPYKNQCLGTQTPLFFILITFFCQSATIF